MGVFHQSLANDMQWFIYNYGLMGPGTRCFQYQWVPTTNLWVLNTIFNDESAITIASRDSLGLAEIKTYAQKMQDAQVTKSLDMLQFERRFLDYEFLGLS